MQPRTAREPDDADRGDRDDADDDVPRGVTDLVEPERRADVMGHEERREGDDDQVVEEERPAGDEPDEVVEGAAGERLRPTHLRDRSRSLGVGERDEAEDDAGEGEHERGQAERLRGDDPERDVDGGGDLAVGDREERGCVEDSLEAANLASHPLAPRLAWGSAPRLRSSVNRATPSATNRPPRRKPSVPPPSAAVRTRSATPIATRSTAIA